LARTLPHLDYIKRKENVGAPENIRLGLSEIRTKYFSILNDDDFLVPRFYVRTLSALERYPTARAVVLQSICVDETGRILAEFRKPGNERLYSGEEALRAIVGGEITSPWNGILFSSECLELFDSVLRTQDVGIDVRVLMRVAARYPVANLPEPGACITYHARSWSSQSQHELDPRFPVWIAERYQGVIDDPYVPEPVKRWAIGQLGKAARSGKMRRLRFVVKESLRRYLISLVEDEPNLGLAVRSQLARGGHWGIGLMLSAAEALFRRSAGFRSLIRSQRQSRALAHASVLDLINERERNELAFINRLPCYEP
jgi:hypothetical protein